MGKNDLKHDRITQAAVTMAVAILVERINSLPQEDQEDLFELVKELSQADGEERESIVVTMLEILEQAPVRLIPVDQSDEYQPGKGLQKWIDYVSKKIRELRRQADLTQDALADKSGLPQSHLSRLENGQHSPSRVTLEKIASALGVEVSVFDPSI